MANVLERTTKQLLKSVHTPDYPDGYWIINPDLSAVVGVPNKYWKITGDVVSEMSQSEKDTEDAAAVPNLQENYLEEEYQSGRLVKASWFAKKESNGSYSYKVSEKRYTYVGKLLTSAVEEYYDSNANITATKSWTFSTVKVGKKATVKKENGQ